MLKTSNGEIYSVPILRSVESKAILNITSADDQDAELLCSLELFTGQVMFSGPRLHAYWYKMK
jgi:hypothetical protein